jgi:hypothetical protein
MVALAVLSGTMFERSTAHVVALVFGEGIAAAAVIRVLHLLGSTVTKTFVDVVRYLDNSPRVLRRSPRRAGRAALLGVPQELLNTLDEHMTARGESR